MLTWLLAAQRPDRVVAAVPFYGFPQGDSEPGLDRPYGDGPGPHGLARRLLYA